MSSSIMAQIFIQKPENDAPFVKLGVAKSYNHKLSLKKYHVLLAFHVYLFH